MFEYETIHIGNSTIYIIRYDHYYSLCDYLPILHPSEQKRLDEFSSLKRKAEFVSTRIMKEQIFPGHLIRYTAEGSPFIKDMANISISHCKGHSAIAVCNHNIIGLDIEPLGDKAKRLVHKFLNEKEQSLLDVGDEIMMTRAWSCKESLLKLSGRKGLLFKRDLIIESYNESESFVCSILKGDQKFSVHLTSKVLDQMIVTINHTNLFRNEFD